MRNHLRSMPVGLVDGIYGRTRRENIHPGGPPTGGAAYDRRTWATWASADGNPWAQAVPVRRSGLKPGRSGWWLSP